MDGWMHWMADQQLQLIFVLYKRCIFGSEGVLLVCSAVVGLLPYVHVFAYKIMRRHVIVTVLLLSPWNEVSFIVGESFGVWQCCSCQVSTCAWSTHKISYQKVIMMHVWRCSLPVRLHIQLYSQKGISPVVEKLSGMQNASIHPMVCKLCIKVHVHTNSLSESNHIQCMFWVIVARHAALNKKRHIPYSRAVV